MKTCAILALAAVAKLASAHATVYSILVNDVDQGLSNAGSTGYIRNPPNNDPVTDVTSPDMTCNKVSGKAAKTVSVKGGDKITFEWHHNDNSANDDIIAESHHGPVMTYIAPGASDGKGDVWVKLAEEGHDGSKTGGWAVDKLIKNRGKHSITLPDLAAGDYLLRPEIIALHEGNRIGGAQFYMECIQVRVTSSGAKSLPAGVAIPGAYKATDAGVKFDIYSGFSSYPIPGPKVWDGASGGAAPAPVPAPATTASAVPTTLRTLVLSSTAAAVPTTGAAVPTTTAAPETPASSTPVAPAPAPTNACPGTGNGGNAGNGGNTGAAAAKWAQCGGQNFNGPTSCVSGSTCKVMNPYYSQCI